MARKTKKNTKSNEKIVPDDCRKVMWQGDIALVRVDAIPPEAKKAADGIVAHSETGHHHVALDAVRFTTADARTMFLEAVHADKPIRIVHERPWDTHQTYVLPPGSKWMVRRQREHTPEGWRMVQD